MSITYPNIQYPPTEARMPYRPQQGQLVHGAPRLMPPATPFYAMLPYYMFPAPPPAVRVVIIPPVFQARGIQLGPQIGYGGKCTVYRGRRTSPENGMQEELAIKVSMLTPSGENNRWSFDQEAAMLQETAANPHVVTLVDRFSFRASPQHHPQTVHLLEKMDCSLLDAVEGQRLTQQEIDQVTHDLLNGVHSLREQEIFHRDLTPRNVLLKRENGALTTKISDLDTAGKAALVGYQYFNGYRAAAISRAPELCAHAIFNPFEADLWGLGCTLFELHTGSPLFMPNRQMAATEDQGSQALLHLHSRMLGRLPSHIRDAARHSFGEALYRELSYYPPYNRELRRAQIFNELTRYQTVRGGVLSVPSEARRRNIAATIEALLHPVGNKRVSPSHLEEQLSLLEEITEMREQVELERLYAAELSARDNTKKSLLKLDKSSHQGISLFLEHRIAEIKEDPRRERVLTRRLQEEKQEFLAAKRAIRSARDNEEVVKIFLDRVTKRVEFLDDWHAITLHTLY